jgi:hypothetical protein
MVEWACKLFRKPDAKATQGPQRRLDARGEWRRYRQQATLAARARRVVPAALAFWLLTLMMVYGIAVPLSPHRGELTFWFSLANGLILAGLPFVILLFAAIDEAILVSGLLRRLQGTALSWHIGTDNKDASLDAHRYGPAIDYWLTTELIAERTAPAAQVVHLPFVVILFLLFSLSTRFDNWNIPVIVILLILVSIAIAVLGSWQLRGTARRIRQQVIGDLEEEISGIEYAEAKSDSERLRVLRDRINEIRQGAYTDWYREPVIRALAWVLAIGVLVVTEYARVG